MVKRKNSAALAFALFCALNCASGYTINQDEIKKAIEESFDTRDGIYDKSGSFIFGGLGFSARNFYQGVRSKSKGAFALPVIFFGKFGAQTFFTQEVGVRGFVGASFYSGNISYTQKSLELSPLFAFLSLGVDAIVQVPFELNGKSSAFGWFLGVGVGATSYYELARKRGSASVNVIVQGGFEFSYGNKRISLGATATPINDSKNYLKQTDTLPFIMYGVKF